MLKTMQENIIFSELGRDALAFIHTINRLKEGMRIRYFTYLLKVLRTLDFVSIQKNIMARGHAFIENFTRDNSSILATNISLVVSCLRYNSYIRNFFGFPVLLFHYLHISYTAHIALISYTFCILN